MSRETSIAAEPNIMAYAIGGHEWIDSGPSILEGIRRLNSEALGATVPATGESMAPDWATFANATMARSLDYDNHHAKGVIHGGSSVVSCALAAAEEVGADGRNLITAVVVGYGMSPRHDGAVREAVAGTVARLEQSTVDELLAPLRRGST